ncbi:MAG TPA: DNA-binding protein [Clostridiales bacterium]|nr:DNA-binding protein [Clostridiales bacterium]
MDINVAVSYNIKRARESKKLTLDAAAAVTGVSRSMLAQIEKGDVNPTISVLWKIANGYKVSFTSLVEKTPERASVIRLEDVTPIIENDGKYINYPVFNFDEERLFEIYRIVIAPMGELEASPHLGGTEEYITVFAGDMEITAGDEIFNLHKGDSVRFKADVQHKYKNTGTIEAQLSMLIYYAK